MKRIPIKAAKDIAKKYGYNQVIVWAWDRKNNIQWLTTFGVTVEDADQAAQGGNYLKRELLGWPGNQCCAEPSRVKHLRKRIKELEREVNRLIKEKNLLTC